jgi:hypothetical protein
MLNDNAKLWVEALRSGKYRQGTGYLTQIRDGQEFDCCLGVACKVAIENGVQFEPRQVVKRSAIMSSVQYGPCGGNLPWPVQRWLGVNTSMGLYQGGSLYGQNDSMGKTFAEIADIIESEPEGLFVTPRPE